MISMCVRKNDSVDRIQLADFSYIKVGKTFLTFCDARVDAAIKQYAGFGRVQKQAGSVPLDDHYQDK